MMTLSSFDEIVKYLEQHENSQRIKKLIFFACKDEWENDQSTLDRFQLQELIQELLSLNPTIENLNSNLSIAVRNLSKPKQYSIIAGIIIKKIQELYRTADEETGIISNPPNSDEETGIISNPLNPDEETGIISNSSNQNIPIFYTPPEQKPLTHLNKTPTKSRQSKYNQFDLRQNIMRYTNPMRVKIILFSALNKNFTFNEQDWLKLKSEELDNLLRKLFDSCPTIKDMESKINNAVISLGNREKNTQVASVIIRVMRGLYSDIPDSSNLHKPVNNYSSEKPKPSANHNYQPTPITIDDFDDFYDNDDNDDNTCQITVPPN